MGRGGAAVAAVDSDGSVHLWHRTGEHHSLPRTATALAFSPDNRMLAMAGVDGRITLWDTRTGDLIRSWKAFSTGLSSIVFSPDGRTVATAGDFGKVATWKVP